jgi:hypothetical protein
LIGRLTESFSCSAVGSTIEDLVLLAECSFEGEWEGQARFLPFEIVTPGSTVFVAEQDALRSMEPFL